MTLVDKPLRRHGYRSLLLALLFATTGALAAGDRPPEGKAPLSERPAACPEPKSGSPASSSSAPGPESGSAACDASGRAVYSPANAAKSRVSRPDRYGTGYEARKGLGGGAGRGRGR